MSIFTKRKDNSKVISELIEGELYSKFYTVRLVLLILIVLTLFTSLRRFFSDEIFLSIGIGLFSLVLLLDLFRLSKTKKVVFSQFLSVLTIISLVILRITKIKEVDDFFYLAGLLPTLIVLLFNGKRNVLFSLFIGLVFFLVSYYFLTFNKLLSFYLSFSFYYIISGLGMYFLFRSIFGYIIDLEEEKYRTTAELDAQKNFLHRFSHQLRTPLNNIIGVNEFFARTELDDIQQDYLDTIAASALTLLDVIEILDKRNKTRIDRSKDELDEIKFNIYLTLNNFIDFSKSQNKNLIISLKIDENFPARVIGNPIKLKQILFIIFESYKKYNSEKKLVVELELKAENFRDNTVHYNLLIKKIGKIHINKPDEIENKSQDNLIELLDIKLVKDLCKYINSKLYITIEEDYTLIGLKGQFERATSVIVSKDNSNEDEDKKPIKEDRDEILEEVTSEKGLLKSANVLLVEDNLINQKVILLALETFVANIDVANNGKEALEIFGRTKYDIILMDIQMPVMDGLKAAIKIREIEKSTNSYTPIIAVTANALQGDKHTCLQAGMDEYITKPIQIELLKEMMSKLIYKNSGN